MNPCRFLSSIACLSVASIAATSFAQFSSDPANQFAVANQSGDQNQPKIRIAPDGSFSISYLSTQGTGWDSWVQRLSNSGVEQFPHNGLNVADTNFSSTEDYGLAVDTNGNTMVAFRDDHTGTVRVGLQKVAPDGSLPWGPYGIAIPGALVGSTDNPHSPGVVCTSDGGYVVRFTQGTTTNTATSKALYQKVDSSGNLLWNGGQAIIVSPATNGYTAADMVASDNGSVVAFIYTIGSFTVSRRIMVMKLDSATGALLWTGSPAVVQTNSTLQIGNFPAVISDGANGGIVAWYETPNGAYMCRAQHVDSNGTQLFPAGGAAVASTTGRLRVSPWVSYDATTSSTYMMYTESDTLQSLWSVYAQKFDAAGTRQWGDGGVGLTSDSSFQNSFIRIVPTGGGIIGAWFMGTNAASSTQTVQATKLNSDGTFAWPANIIMVDSNGGAAKTRMEAVATSDGGAVFVYGDGTAGSLDIMASRINPDGTLGNPAGPTCGSADFNCDGDIGTDADIEAFFSCLAGNCPAAPCTGSADFNGDGDTGTDADIEAFFRVLAGGTC